MPDRRHCLPTHDLCARVTRASLVRSAACAYRCTHPQEHSAPRADDSSSSSSDHNALQAAAAPSRACGPGQPSCQTCLAMKSPHNAHTYARPHTYTAGRQTPRSPGRVRRAALNGNTDKLRWASRSPQPRVPWRALRTGPLARGRQVRAGLPSRSDHGVPTPGCCWCFAARSHRMLRVRRPPSALPSAQEARTARWERDAIKQSRKGRMVEECTLHSSVWWE
ncbi:hypothetical protein C8Q70DRAFT_162877 [Cubamyces menziesii]|nr:hypothetical protein C8Q70DRAFT_162877 [Cubamyces menziesii]